MWEDYIARIGSNGITQSLGSHSLNVADILSYNLYYPNTLKLLAYLHDLGKLSKAFQEYVKNGGRRGSVIHAWQGAFFSDMFFPNESYYQILLKEIINFCIAAHHNHLPDGIELDGTALFYEKLLKKDEDKYFFKEIESKIAPIEKEKLQTLFENAHPEIAASLSEIQKKYNDRNSAYFALGLFIKYLFACLVDADRLDAYLFSIEEKYSYKDTEWDPLINIFEKNISKFPALTEIDRLRRNISDECKKEASRETGIYQLSVPTGGGKTLSSLRFALHHCKQHNKDRIIYVIPYLSIIEQTSKNIQDILELSDSNEILLEHHSNIVELEDEKSSEIRKVSSSRWDAPIIVTTMVQFMESVMSSKSGKLRKFSSIANSVIIFDEIQMLPIKAIHCFNEIATFLSNILNTTIITCSATQPTLEETQRKNLSLSGAPHLVGSVKDFEKLKRVNVEFENEKNYEEAAEFIYEKANKNGNCLTIVNTKKSAFELYRGLKNKPNKFKIVHLSTLMCSKHRIQIIKEVKECLSNKEPIICISTQLIEAGVDISFMCVIRAMAGLDSIAQAAGRCNRNGESKAPKSVYTFSLKEENLDRLFDIKNGKELSIDIITRLGAQKDILGDTVMRKYYREYFDKKSDQMDYPVANNWIYKMLSGNESGRNNYKTRTGEEFPHYISHAFNLASENFKLIEDNTKPVIVIWNDSERLIEEYRKEPKKNVTKKKIILLKELQKYSVSLYEWQIKKLMEHNALSLLDEETEALILDKNYYSKEVGAVLNIIEDNLII
ncbi:MAG: CRISPR-associated helicase Cas3' [Anaerovoracaceae bacterium]